MTDVTAKVGENWGGSAAAEKLGAIQHLLGPIVADGKRNKPDWKRLLERVTETLGLVEPVRELVYVEVKRHETLTSAIESTEQFVASLAGDHYKRTICGIVFGASLYCSNSGLTELVAQARQQLGTRDYDSAIRSLTELKSKVGRNHIECCWMLLQSMACTTEPCAVRYAHENGYCDGMFEQWAEQRLRNAEGDSFQVFQLPELVSGTNHSRSGALTLSDAVDEPVVTDYEPAYEA